MTVNELCEDLMNVLERFDENILPLGLYSCDDLAEKQVVNHRNHRSYPWKNYVRQGYQEWVRAIEPHLSGEGYTAIQPHRLKDYVYVSHFDIPEIGRVNLTIARLAKIKVRKYGSSYRVDIHEQRAQRWAELELGSYISKVWHRAKQSNIPGMEILLLIGFDKAKNPLGQELLELQDSLHWEEKGVTYFSRTWDDKANRGFRVRLATWASFVPMAAN
jgi:hypothetical protein